MTIQYEIKSQLAKLLATEDLVVEHKKVETACFNVVSRVLTLPMWDNTTEDVVDMLVSHEVGHALYTPTDEWYKEYKINPNVVNVVEDARIEKLMKRRYEGIAKTFYKGYTELHKEDFFEVKKKDISKLSLADRINLFFKIGSHYKISFTDFEQTLVDRVAQCETFQDVLEVSKDIYEYCMEEIEKRKQEQETEQEAGLEMDSGDGQNSGGTGSELEDVRDDWYDEDGNMTEPDEDGSDVESHQVMPEGMSGGGSQMGTGESEITETADSLERALKNLAVMEGLENHYLELPDVDTDQIIIDNEVIHAICDAHFTEMREDYAEKSKIPGSEREWSVYSLEGALNAMAEADKEFIKFKKEAQKEVNYLVKEFEMKKSAGAYARATTSRTGVLDTTKLINYKFSEDLFKKVTVLPDGKNHGLVFILDWSGSMNNVMMDTLKQLYNLIWFCRKVQIPYDVYAFTSDYPRPAMYANKETFYEPKDMMAEVGNQFALLNMFSSQTRSKDLDTQMINIWRSACIFAWNISTPYLDVPYGYRLSGTPLNEAMVSLHTLLPDFQKRTGVEKVQCVVLTDGESQPLRYHREVQRQWEDEPYMGTNYFGENCVLRDRKLGKTYISKDSGRYETTDMLLEHLKDCFPQTNFIGIRVLPSREGGSFIRRYCGYETEDTEKMMRRWKKEKSFAIKTSGYHTYFGMASSALNNDGELVVKEDATKAEIKRAFAKSLKGKKMNKKILSEFIELVA